MKQTETTTIRNTVTETVKIEKVVETEKSTAMPAIIVVLVTVKA